MKRIISLTIALCLVFGSFSFVFASATQWDTTDQANLRLIANSVTSGGTLYNLVNSIYSRMNTINNNIVNIKDALFHGSSSIATLVYNIQTWMSPIYNAVLETPIDLKILQGLLGYPTTDSSTGVTTWNSYPAMLKDSMTNIRPGLGPLQSNADIMKNSHLSLNWIYSNGSNTGSYSVPFAGPNGTHVNATTYWNAGSPIGNIAYLIYRSIQSNTTAYEYRWAADLIGYNASQTYYLWTGDELTTNSFTPSSATNGLYQWLSNIQAPVARLSYVLASDERIEAQEAAAANEEAVVDNFIDSTGSGSVGVSDFGSLSNASGAMKSNFETGQSAAGVFNVFDDSHFLYLSQSAADQLDTTGSNNINRLLKSSGSNYDTPALDRYYEELNEILEVNKDD